jgi:Ser/Thr protein kinase RdoA (MazF antagonist)
MADDTDTPPIMAAAALLARSGRSVDAGRIELERREDRWLGRPGDGLAVWLRATDAGIARLATERRVLQLLAERCDFAVPRVLYADGAGDIRSMVPGESDPVALAALLGGNPSLAASLGDAIGKMLAQQHSRIALADVDGWLRRGVAWPEPLPWIRERLPSVFDDAGLLARIETVLHQYERRSASDAELALVHSDLGLHNLAFDPDARKLAGIFDYDGAAWDDRHHDFRYLAWQPGRTEMLDAAIASYASETGVAIDRQRVRLYNAASAICFLAYRNGVPPETRWCGRTLVEDLAWVRQAVDGLT